MNRLEYFRSRLGATRAPVDVLEGHPLEAERDDGGSRAQRSRLLIGDRIVGALQVPQNTILERFDQLPSVVHHSAFPEQPPIHVLTRGGDYDCRWKALKLRIACL